MDSYSLDILNQKTEHKNSFLYIIMLKELKIISLHEKSYRPLQKNLIRFLIKFHQTYSNKCEFAQ